MTHSRNRWLFTIPQPYVPITGMNRLFPVHRIYCIGRNYAAHAREMGADPSRELPFFFQKPNDAVQVIPAGVTVGHPYPSLTQNYHHEVELVVALQSGGSQISPEKALEHVYGYAVGLDMTRRDLQRALADQKKPWELGKSFDNAAPLGPIHPASQIGHLAKGRIQLSVNGQVRQDADLSHMIWSVAEQISKLSEAFRLRAGDLIYTGTPENVGPIKEGDVLDGHIEGLSILSLCITPYMVGE